MLVFAWGVFRRKRVSEFVSAWHLDLHLRVVYDKAYSACGICLIFWKEMKTLHVRDYWAGVKAGLPVCIGYFSVSFGFGAMAVSQGLSVWYAVLISMVNLTSAGQFAGLTVIAAGATMVEMILTQLVINSRYGLMSLALGQKFGPSVGTGKRLAAAFFNTDEVFALGMAREGKLTVSFFVGAGMISALGWIAGTAAGALAGSVLPEGIRAALGVMLYGMFIAIVTPQARQEKPILLNVVLALVLSCMFTWLPVLREVSSGLAIVICTVAAAAITAVVSPVEMEAAQ